MIGTLRFAIGTLPGIVSSIDIPPSRSRQRAAVAAGRVIDRGLAGNPPTIITALRASST
jgi:hypothetical protein